MRSSRTLELLVGLFVCLGIAAAFILTFRVSNLAGSQGLDGYAVHARFENVGGLKPGSAVTMAGVRVGRVTAIKFDNETLEAKVAMEIGNAYDQIPKDSSASIFTAGLLGEQYIGLTPGGSLESLSEGDEIRITQSALILEQLIGQFLFDRASSTKETQ